MLIALNTPTGSMDVPPKFHGLIKRSTARGTNQEGAAMGGKRDAYIEEVKSKLDKWNKEINQFQAKAKKAKTTAQVQLHKEIDEIKGKRKLLEEKISDMQRSSETAWEDIKGGVDTAWKSLGDSIQTAKSRFN
jgi:chromosome segregation ATPase